MTDPLPAGVDWTLGAVTGDTSGVLCSIGGAVGHETLTCTDASMAAGDHFTVHVSAPTDPTDCGTVDNTATVTSTNDGGGQASASVDVVCPDIEVIKDAPNDTIPAGQDLVFTITVRNIGDGIARDVVLHDTLPAGFAWDADNAACQIAAGQLTCAIGDMDPADVFTVTLTAPTSADPDTGNIDCSEGGTVRIPNVASADASNEGADVLGNNSDDAVIDVLCSALLIEKDVTGNTGGTFNDPGSPLNGLKQAKIGDTLTYHLTYAGSGPLTNAVISDPVPAGLSYVAGSASSDANFTFDAYDAATRTLTWKAATLPDPVSGELTFQVTVLAAAAEIGIVLNVATIDSDQTPPDDGDVPIGVLPPPEALTPPPTDVFTPVTGTSNPGFALMLVLLAVAVVTIGIGFVTPVPTAARRSDRRR
jgi:uncharacterized repeat protein (TIGR01451 family)